MRRRPLVQVLVTLGAALTVVGCIAFVNDDPSSLTATCHYDGDDTACGRCVATACSKALDACCGDSTCTEASLPLLTSCFSESSLCSTFLSESPDLASCITTSCAGCSGNSVIVTQDGGTSPATDAGSTDCTPTGDSCFCTVASDNGNPANGVTCNTAGIKGGGLCCASYGWPTATDATCECEPFSCTPESFGIVCQLGSDSTGTTSCSDGCSFGTYCQCTSDTCDETSVAQCDVSQVACDSSEVQVTSCSF